MLARHPVQITVARGTYRMRKGSTRVSEVFMCVFMPGSFHNTSESPFGRMASPERLDKCAALECLDRLKSPTIQIKVQAHTTDGCDADLAIEGPCLVNGPRDLVRVEFFKYRVEFQAWRR